MKFKKIKIILFVILSFSSLQCGKLCFENKIVKIEQTQYTGTELKIDGYYVKNCESENFKKIFIFYNNGVFLTPNSLLMSGCYGIKYSEVTNIFTHEETKKDRVHYGLFNTSNDTLYFEGFKATYIGNCNPAYLITAKILNDSTFIVIKEERSRKPNEYTILSDTFHYVHATEKPDSTNEFFP